MTERLRESLSALMDDEGDDLELGRVLREMDADDELRGAWDRYHLVRAVLRGEQVDALTGRSLAIDPPEVAADGPAGERGDVSVAHPERWRPLAGFAAAACVTLALVVGLQPADPADVVRASPALADAPSRPIAPGLMNAALGGAPVSGAPVSGAAAAAALARARVHEPGAVSGGVHGIGPGARSASTDPAALRDPRERIEAYMLYHAEHSAVNSRVGMVPFARMAAFEPRQ